MHGPTAASMPLAPRAELLHRLDGRVGHAGERAAPAGMGGADHPAFGSANSTGAQSAVRMPSSRSGRSVTIASACGRSSCGQAARHRRHRPNGPGGRWRVRRPGSSAAIARRRFSAIASRSSLLP